MSNKKNPDFPRMGERFRLRQDFDVKGFSPHAQASASDSVMLTTPAECDARLSAEPAEALKLLRSALEAPASSRSPTMPGRMAAR